MKLLKNSLALLLIGCMLLLSACSKDTTADKDSGSDKESGGKQNVAGEGRYMETNVTPNAGGQLMSFLAEDGSIICYSQGLVTQYKSTDGGKSWSESQGPGANSERYMNIRNATLLENGNLLVYSEEELMNVAPNGDATTFPVDEVNKATSAGQFVNISLLQALSNNKLLLSYSIIDFGQPPQGEEQKVDVSESQSEEATDDEQGEQTKVKNSMMSDMQSKTAIYDTSTGQIVAEIPIESATAATSDDSSVYVMDYDGKVTAYNLSNGKPSDKPEISLWQAQSSGVRTIMNVNMGVGGNTLAIGEDGTLYAAYNGSLLSADANGRVSTVLESTAYSIGAPRSSVSSVFALDDGSFIVNMGGMGVASNLYKYAWDANAAIDPNKTLAIWSLQDNSFVRAAIAETRKKNPDAYITYEVALSENNNASASDAIKTLNTQLLNGNGPDIIILDGSPEASYVSKGMLLELGGLIDTSDIYENLLAPYNNDGKLYCLPTQFITPALMSDADALSKAQTLDDIVKLVVEGNHQAAGMGAPGAFSAVPESERSTLNFTDLKELNDVMWPASAPAIVADNQLNSDALSNYLTALKAINDKYKLSEEKGDGIFGMTAFASDGGSPIQLTTSLISYTSQQANYAAFTAGSLQLMQMMMERAGSELKPFPGLKTDVWQPSTVAAISADTKVKDFAAKFMQTMLSVDVQQFNYGTGLSVTRSGTKAQVDSINQRLTENDLGTFSLDADAFIAKLQTPYASDAILADMMWSSIEKCCKGELDIEGAVKAIEQNVKNYLAERR